MRSERAVSEHFDDLRKAAEQQDDDLVDRLREFDLLDGRWYAGQPYDDWAWMREHAPAYWDAKNEVWALTRYDDVLAVEKDPATFSSHRAPRPARRPPAR